MKNVAQKTTRCLEAMKSSEWRADDGTHLFPGLNQSGCRNRGAGRRARQATHTHIARAIKVGRVEHRSGEPTSSELSGTTRTGSSGTTSQRPNREAWRTSSPSQAARKESGTRFFGESTRSSQSHLPVPGESSAAPTILVSQCAESVVDGALDELMALHEEVFLRPDATWKRMRAWGSRRRRSHTCGRNQG